MGLRRLRWGSDVEPLSILAEEVVLQDVRDAHQKLRIDSGSLEEFIDVGAVTIELAGEPADGSFLSFQLFLDEFANVQAGLLGVVQFVHTLLLMMSFPLSRLDTTKLSL